MNIIKERLTINQLLINSLIQAGFKHSEKGISEHCYILDIGTGNPEDYPDSESPKIVFDVMPLYNCYGFMYSPGEGSIIFTHLQNPAEAKEWARQILSFESPYLSTMKQNNGIDATVEKLSAMYFETRKAKDSLRYLTEQPHFNEIFTEGERGSIHALIQSSEMRLDIIRSLQIGL
jgi:hypothetical protein